MAVHDALDLAQGPHDRQRSGVDRRIEDGLSEALDDHRLMISAMTNAIWRSMFGARPEGSDRVSMTEAVAFTVALRRALSSDIETIASRIDEIADDAREEIHELGIKHAREQVEVLDA